MSRIVPATAIAAAVIGLAACSSSHTPDSANDWTTTTAIAPATTTAAATTTIQRPTWVGSGVFSVGLKPSGGAKASIPPGRYTVELQTGHTSGIWYRCTGLPCSPTSGNAIDVGSASGAGFSTVIDILPTDGAIYGDGVNFVAAE